MTLRERSKSKRRAAIEHAALHLFAERGYDATTVAQVAELAEVSPRTVSLYFPSKLDLALSYTAAAAQRLADAVAARDPDETTLEVMHRWIQEEFDGHAESIILQRAMLRSNPQLRGAETDEIGAAKAVVTIALADDLGRRPDDIVVALVGGAFEGIIARLTLLDPAHPGTPAALDEGRRLLDAVVATFNAPDRRGAR